jgi:hypothetical protein
MICSRCKQYTARPKEMINKGRIDLDAVQQALDAVQTG